MAAHHIDGQLDKESVLCLSGTQSLKMRDKGTLKKEDEKITLAGKRMLWLSNTGSVEYCT